MWSGLRYAVVRFTGGPALTGTSKGPDAHLQDEGEDEGEDKNDNVDTTNS